MSIISLKGEVIYTHAREIQDQVENLAKRNRLKVVINFAGVDHMGSGGFGALVACKNILSQKKGELMLCCMIKSVENIFRLTGFHNYFDHFMSEEEAIEALR